MRYKMNLGGRIGINDLNNLIDLLVYNPDMSEILINLEKVSFIEPAAMSLLTAYVNYVTYCALAQRKIVRFFTARPVDENVHRYLQRMNFYENIGLKQENGFKRHDGTDSFKEVLILQSETDSNQVSEDLIKILQSQTKIDTAFLRILRYSVTEIAENIFHHAESPIGGVVCAQAYKSKGKVQISIVDAGRGIPQNIRTIPGCADYDDKSAIEKAVQLKVTSRPESNAGQGLFFSSQITTLNGGIFTIRSLHGSIELTSEGMKKNDSKYWQGSAVIFELPMQPKFTLKELMDKHAPPENDFKFIKEK